MKALRAERGAILLFNYLTNTEINFYPIKYSFFFITMKLFISSGVENQKTEFVKIYRPYRKTTI